MNNYIINQTILINYLINQNITITNYLLYVVTAENRKFRNDQ